MPIHFRLTHPLLAIAPAALLWGQAPAQRPYQQYWQERLAEEDAGREIVEDDYAPLDPAAEERLGSGPIAEQLSLSFFPGQGTAFEDEERDSLRSYVTGVLSLESRQAPEALERLEEALAANPESRWLRLRMADAAILANDFSRAATVLDEILERDPEDLMALRRKGDLMQMRRRMADARALYEQALEVEPDNIEALQSLTQMAFEVYGDLEMAKDYSLRILRIDDRNLNAILWHAQACAFTGEPGEAADYYAQLVRARPMLFDRMVDDARRVAAQGDVRDALVILERAVMINPSQETARSLWERLQLRLDGPRAINEGYERLLEKEPASLALHDIYARRLLRADECPDPRDCADRIDWDRLMSLREASLERDPEHIPALLDLGVAKLVREGFEEAEPYYRRAMEARPTSPEVLHSMAEVFLPFEGQRHRAMELYEQILLVAPGDTRAMAALAEMKLEDGETSEAMALLERALEEQPDNASILEQLAAAELDQGNRAKAREHLERATAADPSDILLWMNLAKVLLEDGDDAALLEFEERALGRIQRTIEFNVLYGLLTQDHGRYDRSRHALERAVEANPHDLRARTALSRAYLHLGDEDRAVAALREAEEYIGEAPVLRRMRDEYLASVYLELHRNEDAKNVLEDLVERYPGDLALREMLLQTLVRLGDTDGVDQALNEAVREHARERPLETTLLRANVLLRKGEPARALSLLQDAEDAHPANEELAFRIALAAAEKGDLETAETYYRRLIDDSETPESPYFEVSSNNLGYLFAQEGIRLEEAEELIKQALDVNPNAPYILDSLGWVYFQMGDYEKAQPYLERAARLAFRDAEIYSNLGQLYEKIGEDELARRYYDRAIEVDPSMRVARERREALARSAGDSGAGPEL